MPFRLKPCGAVYGGTPLGNCRIVSPADVPGCLSGTDAVVVIDTLRAATTILAALHGGVAEVLPVLDDARAAGERGEGVILAGERNGQRLPGYDFNNSPADIAAYLQRQRAGRLVLKTSNLIPLLLQVPAAWICAGVNIAATARCLRGRDVCIVPAGGSWGISEDAAVAFGLSARIAGHSFPSDLIAAITRESGAAQHLRDIGCGSDVEFAARVDLYEIAAVFDGHCVTRVVQS